MMLFEKTPLLALVLRCVIGALLTCGIGPASCLADWPAWRHDAGRSGASPEELPASLHLQWVVQYPPREPVWQNPLNQDLMRYDRVFEPIVADQMLLVGFNDTDKLAALDIDSGQEKWRFYTDGPVRLPPVAEAGRVYFVSDDGWLYCLRIADGTLLWKYRGGPADRKILGNERLISCWPARGAPVLYDGSVYFTASIWPLMGTFIHALDAATGRLQWVNDGTSAQFINQPHNYPAFAGVAPQGNLVATEEALLIPGGRSVPACFDRRTGEFRYFHLADYGKYGGSWAFAHAGRFFAHVRDGKYLLYNLETGRATEVQAQQPVLTHDSFYTSGQSVARYKWAEPKKELWKVDVDATRDLIKAGDRLYAAGSGGISAIQETDGIDAPHVAWQKTVEGGVERLLAADDRLFAVTFDGRIMAYGAEKPASGPQLRTAIPAEIVADTHAELVADSILESAQVNDGYCLLYGVGDGQLLEALASRSNLQIVAVDPDVEKIDRLRRKYDAAGLYGGRLALLVGDIHSVDTPPYMSSLTVVHDIAAAGYDDSPSSVSRVFQSLRPYGGAAYFPGESTEQDVLARAAGEADLQRATVARRGDFLTLSRDGALPGAGVWTHQYGNSANTIKSDDRRVKLPLGVLWFGGSSNMDVLPRHGHGPPEQIIGGRLFIEGMDCLSARDVYTGRVLWKVPLGELGNFGVYYDETYKDLPLTLNYNQVHIPGANARGTNFVATLDRIYIIQANRCRVLDAATGETLQYILLRDPDSREEAARWGYLAVHGEALIGGANFANFSRTLALPHEKDPKDTKSKWRFDDYDRAASEKVVVMDRFTGQPAWAVNARYGLLHNGIAVADGKVFCLDRLPTNVENRLARRGQQPPEDYRLLALDLASGESLWEDHENVFGSWLAYSTEHDVLLQSTRPSSDMVRDETGARMIVYQADTGQVIWDKKIQYNTPPILHGDDIIAGGRRYSLLTGEPRYRLDPITGKRQLWSYASTKGCNYPIAAENLLTFRSSAAAFFDLQADGGTGHFGGFKSGCTSNLIAADGVLNAPEYTRTCRCSFQNQTSLALVHMPELELWTHNDIRREHDIVKRVGINFGAPGDRRADNGTLWMEFPSVGGPSPNIVVDVEGDATFFRRHMSRAGGDGPPWVAASGMEGARQVIVHLAGGGKAFDGTLPVIHSADDAEESPDGQVDLDSGDLQLASGDGRHLIGLRFADLPIPRGARIKTATIQFTADEDSDQPTSLRVFGQASDDAAAFRKKSHDLSSRPSTERFAEWSPARWPVAGESGPRHRTPELASILQEIVDRPGWKPAHAVAFLIAGTGERIAESFDGSANQAPTLHVDFEIPDAPPAVDYEMHVPRRGYTVRLHFAEPEDDVTRLGKRVFDVSLQGETVLSGLDIGAEAGSTLRSVVKEFQGVTVADELRISLTPRTQRGAVLCGVEVVAE